MDRVPVSSTNLVSVGYDSDSQTLEIEFKGNSVYQYFGVPPHIYEELVNAPSKGSYHHQHIKDVYPYAKT